ISFSYTQEQDSVIDIRIAVTGGKEDRDREYEIAVDTASTAISGVHFEPLPQKLTIKKGELSDVIKLRLLRTPEMETTSYILKLNLLPNANFGTRFQTRMVGGKAMSTISTKVRIDDVLKKPARWVDANWGVFTRVKLFFVCEFLGITPFYLEDGLTPAENYSLPRMVQRHLDKLKDEGNTKFEADGTPMTMGPQSK
uniref:DUF4843 domain-containing protein n=1 Tax=Sphingobacterium lumbrici TaxID=2559600 RepID=UPI0015E4395F